MADSKPIANGHTPMKKDKTPYSDTNEVIILTTTDTLELAQGIASALVEAREAVCINIISGVHSIYRREGKAVSEGEFLLLIKSSAEKFEAVRSRIRLLHTYQVPEVIVLPIISGDPDYLHWLGNELRSANDK